jgi:hypothetical protein
VWYLLVILFFCLYFSCGFFHIFRNK